MDSKEIRIDDKQIFDDQQEPTQQDQNPFGLDSQELEASIPKEDTGSKFFEGNEEKKMIEIKQDLIKGLTKGIGRKLKKSKIQKGGFKKKGKSLNDIKMIFLSHLSKLTSNDTKENALKEIIKLFEGTAKDDACLKIYLHQLLNKRLTKKSFVNFEMEIAALNHLIHI